MDQKRKPRHQRIYEVRCPIYGFIKLNDWERSIVDEPAFQRLRRIRQLGWTDYIYPGAVHTRFEHSLGVMHMATLLFDGIVERSRNILEDEMGYNEEGLKRHRALLRLTALLHDIGHSPFSHSAEELMPKKNGKGDERYSHEDYSAAIVRRDFKKTIRDHQMNKNYDFSADDVANLLEGNTDAANSLFWRCLITGQIDADRIDYLLRDSYHIGADYGRFDWKRLVNTIEVVGGTDETDENNSISSSPRIGVAEGGWHAAEALILARYFMFTQVYYHKTRVIYDYHLQKALAEMLPNGLFPPPTKGELDNYMRWDDWYVLGKLSACEGGEHGKRLRKRDHFRTLWQTLDVPDASDLDKLEENCNKLNGKCKCIRREVKKAWYKTDEEGVDIPIRLEGQPRKVLPLSHFSNIVKQIKPIRKTILYVDRNQYREAKKLINGFEERQNA